MTTSPCDVSTSACDVTTSACGVTTSACDMTTSACDVTTSAYEQAACLEDGNSKGCDLETEGLQGDICAPHLRLRHPLTHRRARKPQV